MNIAKINSQLSVSGQITADDLTYLAENGVEIFVCNRPDGEAADQPEFAEIEQAVQMLGLTAVNIPFTAGQLDDVLVTQFKDVLAEGKKTHAYCRTGNRSTQIWTAVQAVDDGENSSVEEVSTEVEQKKNLGNVAKPCYDIVIVGAGAGGVAVSASLLKRNSQLRIALVDAERKHYYQPGWTMVGGGIFSAESTQRETASLISRDVSYIQQSVIRVDPEDAKVVLSDQSEMYYQQLIVAPGLVLDWGAIEGLEESLGRNGVTSNYRYDLAPYTWELVQKTKGGKAIFTQAPMPIKCAGAPQKALYLSADYWLKNKSLENIDIEFCNAGGALFGVKEYVPALMSYMDKYGVTLSFNENLVKVNGENKKAWFELTDAEGLKTKVCKSFEMLHVCPPQRAPDFIKSSGIADDGGWLSVDPNTLQHTQYPNIWGVGDVMNTANAKTVAAVRKQVPVVAENVCAALSNKAVKAKYDGYGSCPLTVERGKIVLAEFCYGGRISPTFPSWLNEGTKATRAAWMLKAYGLPTIYWDGMLKGKEWLTKCSPE